MSLTNDRTVLLSTHIIADIEAVTARVVLLKSAAWFRIRPPNLSFVKRGVGCGRLKQTRQRRAGSRLFVSGGTDRDYRRSSPKLRRTRQRRDPMESASSGYWFLALWSCSGCVLLNSIPDQDRAPERGPGVHSGARRSPQPLHPSRMTSRPKTKAFGAGSTLGVGVGPHFHRDHRQRAPTIGYAMPLELISAGESTRVALSRFAPPGGASSRKS